MYLLSQKVNNKYDTYDSCVVAAESEETAKMIHPGSGFGEMFPSWATSPDQVAAQLLGTAKPGTPAGLILASFNAG